jgi:hypothetical protein
MTAPPPNLFPIALSIEASATSVPKQVFIVKPTMWLFLELLKTLSAHSSPTLMHST